jgi:7-cyano-7-deazaguanine synthase in queuosine biosynthesis
VIQLRIKIKLNNGEQKYKIIPDIRPPFQVDKKRIDLRNIGESIFALEDAIHENKQVNEIVIPLYNNYDNISDILEELILFLFLKDIKVTIEKNPQKMLSDFDLSLSDNFTCLFSGGVDSFSGILGAKQYYKRVCGCVTFHPDQKIRGLIERLDKETLQKNKIPLYKITSQRHHKYNRVSRGFLYVMNSSLLGNKNLIIPECGVTMHQPKFTILDEVTMTTHPEVLYYSNRVLEEVFGTGIKIIKPHENLTKSEIVSSCIDKEHLLDTCSCVNTMFCNSVKCHCGVCYGCIIRRIGMIVAGIDDSVRYRTDILSDIEFPSSRLDNLSTLIQFSVDFLSDMENLPFYTRDIITRYGKKYLFQRFSEDILAVLFLCKKNGITNKFILDMYEKNKKVVSEEKLEDRIDEVRTCKFKPKYS